MDQIELPPFTPADNFKAGDIITVPVAEKRKWWQLWKPRYGPPTPATYHVVSVTATAITITD